MEISHSFQSILKKSDFVAFLEIFSLDEIVDKIIPCLFSWPMAAATASDVAATARSTLVL